MNNDFNWLRPVLRPFITVEGLLAFGTEGEAVGPVLRDAVFGSAVEALYYEFIQGGTTPAADGPILQSVSWNTVFLPASEATDNKAVMKHLDSRLKSQVCWWAGATPYVAAIFLPWYRDLYGASPSQYVMKVDISFKVSFTVYCGQRGNFVSLHDLYGLCQRCVGVDGLWRLCHQVVHQFRRECYALPDVSPKIPIGEDAQ